MIEKTLTNRTITALNWRFLSVASMVGIQFGVNIVLARLLPVESFGILGLALIIIGLAKVVSEIGIGSAIVQRKNITDDFIRVGFTLSVLIGIVFTIGMIFFSPIVSIIFKAKGIVSVVRVISLIFFIKNLSTISIALLQRNLSYNKVFWIEILSYTLGYASVGITLGYFGWEVWALVWATICQSIIKTIVSYLLSTHSVKLLLRKNEIKQILHFGVGLSLARLANYAARNGDYFVIGRYIGPLGLGLYTRAYQLMTMPISQFSSALSSVLFSAYSEVQDETERIRKAYLKSISVTSFFVMPLLTVMFVLAPEFILLLYGEKWAGAILPFQILCIGGISRAMYNLADSLARAKGAVYEQFRRHLLYAIFIIIASFIGANWGIIGVSVGVVFALILMHIMMTQLSNRLCYLTWKEVLKAQIPGVLVTMAIIITTFPIKFIMKENMDFSNVLIILITLIISGIEWGVFFLFLPDTWLKEIRSIVRKWGAQVSFISNSF